MAGIRDTRADRVFGAVNMGLLTVLVLLVLYPLIYVVSCSVSDPSAVGAGEVILLPKGFTLMGYRRVFQEDAILTGYGNTLLYTVVGTAINILLTTSAAYVLIQPGLMFKKIIMTFLIVMMLFDPGLVPEYLLVKQLGLIGSQWSVILVTSVNVYYLIIMMRYFQAVPMDIYEAARIDGAGHVRMIFSMVFPLAKSGIATITMFYAVVRWNEYFKASIYLTEKAKTTLQVILRQFVVLGDTVSLIGAQNIMDYNELARIDYGALKAATIVIAIVPILLLYPIVLKFYTRDVMAGSVKE